ncbi:alpha/beta fold hydrolase [Dictyobacter aurantiacus]|uniref:2-hydroxy-6-oxo-6-phenylhexa-2,4-dienoate hydrolase n=1 Tax=Dictyobacter aurantiacus TaxID=1936993 RepID=A0A401Z9H3_9CHLR|nr:alpha/beta hydrolase [Dictyobacter aurantiacus]GCE03521.1 2-hydroxy-6-oxo-6-phenylhexa-2,4-dienoate hydrolase [Dictyobacter aurantiacus]
MQCTVRGVPLFYESYGTGTPIILLHGFSSDHRQIKGSMEPLFTQQQGWQRIYLDLPGMGQTPGSVSIQGTDDILDVVVDFIDALIPGQPFLLVGDSYGGYLSQGVLHYKFEQVAGMALICSGLIMERSQRDLPPRAVMVEDRALLTMLDTADAEEFTSMAVVQDRDHWERFRDEVLSGAKLADEAFLQKILQRYSCSFDVGKLPRPFTRPVVLLAGRQDHIAGYRDAWRILENYPHGTFAVLDRAGHDLQIEQPHLFNALVSEWLNRVRESMQSYTLNEMS